MLLQEHKFWIGIQKARYPTISQIVGYRGIILILDKNEYFPSLISRIEKYILLSSIPFLRRMGGF